MKHFKIKSDKKIVGHIYTFLDGYTGKNVIDKILKDVPVFVDTGYGGFRSRSALRLHISWAMFGKIYSNAVILVFKNDTERHAIKIVQNTILKCRKRAKCPGILKILIFPTINEFTKKELFGVGGYSFWKNSINLFINPEVNGWKKELSKIVCHEYSHAVRHNYIPWGTLLDGIIFDGMAEHFREAVIGGKKAPWALVLSEKEARRIIIKLKPKLNSKSKKLYNEVFYTGKKYPQWAGYSIGYYIVRHYLERLDRIDWSEVLTKPAEEILRESHFLD
jgi:uncharacterized protein YjaZ